MSLNKDAKSEFNRALIELRCIKPPPKEPFSEAKNLKPKSKASTVRTLKDDYFAKLKQTESDLKSKWTCFCISSDSSVAIKQRVVHEFCQRLPDNLKNCPVPGCANLVRFYCKLCSRMLHCSNRTYHYQNDCSIHHSSRIFNDKFNAMEDSERDDEVDQNGMQIEKYVYDMEEYFALCNKFNIVSDSEDDQEDDDEELHARVGSKRKSFKRESIGSPHIRPSPSLAALIKRFDKLDNEIAKISIEQQRLSLSLKMMYEVSLPSNFRHLERAITLLLCEDKGLDKATPLQYHYNEKEISDIEGFVQIRKQITGLGMIQSSLSKVKEKKRGKKADPIPDQTKPVDTIEEEKEEEEAEEDKIVEESPPLKRITSPSPEPKNRRKAANKKGGAKA